ncbi:hypothetical protein [Amycolatopsis sp.]|uniref:hypothetical protein n=1 Tax=Amycolatopsis sp. TaxID=37632 RepID=UPI002BA56797|nr:hypothetical protein [Amycolatopsis sp.]HVV11621.1 hypothetical protein [Amycolatopsis sp.]
MTKQKTYRVEPTKPYDGPHEVYRDHHERYPFQILDEVDHSWGTFASREMAEKKIAYMEWEDALPVGKRGSRWLTEVRTVHSRALNALKYVKDPDALDAEDREIHDALLAVGEALDRWKKTGRAPKYPGDNDIRWWA